MPFLKVGSIVFNTDHVVKLELLGDAVSVRLSTPILGEGPVLGASPEPQILRFDGDEATAIQKWIQHNAEDLMPPPLPSAGITS